MTSLSSKDILHDVIPLVGLRGDEMTKTQAKWNRAHHSVRFLRRKLCFAEKFAAESAHRARFRPFSVDPESSACR